MATMNFLTPTINSVRKSIKGIDDSYNNYWDILAELIQNSVDAIRKADLDDGEISINIDAISNSITVKDNGIGMKKELIPILLSPFSTDKDGDMESIGEKGVGLKFVIFQSNNFVLKTHYKEDSDGFSTIVNINNACSWKNSNAEDYPESEINDYTEKGFEGTEITVTGIDNDDLFELNFESILYLLRTKTAIGNVLSLFDDNNNIKVSLVYKDRNGTTNVEKNVQYKYWLPIENIKSNEKYDLDDFKAYCSEGDKSDAEKRKKLKDKVIFQSGTLDHSDSRQIKYWACFLPQRKLWNDISISDKLLLESKIDDEEYMQRKSFSMHQPGIYTSVKGMPTGIKIDHPNTGNAGYWANMFIIFEDKSLKFDIGRKYINGNIQNIYKNYAKNIFNEFTGYVTKYISGTPDIIEVNPHWDRDNVKEEIEKMMPLNCDIVPFEKNPDEQEASVAAIFYELIGANKIENLVPVISGYKNKYDLYARWKSHFIVLEFKTHLRNIVHDFDNYVKYSNEIDYIVCWDVTDEDSKVLHNANISLEKIEKKNLFAPSDDYLPYATHRLSVALSSTPIYVIDLKLLLDNLKKEQ